MAQGTEIESAICFLYFNMLATYAIGIRFCVCHILEFSGIEYDETLFACVVHITTHAEMTWQYLNHI